MENFTILYNIHIDKISVTKIILLHIFLFLSTLDVLFAKKQKYYGYLYYYEYITININYVYIESVVIIYYCLYQNCNTSLSLNIYIYIYRELIFRNITGKKNIIHIATNVWLFWTTCDIWKDREEVNFNELTLFHTVKSVLSNLFKGYKILYSLILVHFA
jgi:hypothetical protein